MKKVLIGALSITMLFTLCKKDQEDPKSLKIVEYNDTIKSIPTQIYSVDINKDNVIDFELKAYYNDFYGGTFQQRYCMIKALNNSEVIIDTVKYIARRIVERKSGVLTDVTDSCLSNTIIPKIFIDTITPKNSEKYLKNKELYLTYDVDTVEKWWTENDPSSDYRTRDDVLSGWSKIGFGYLKFRVVTTNDTLNGWMCLSASNSTGKIILKSIGYKKK